MAQKVSRRKIAEFVADSLLSGDAKIIKKLAAFLVANRRQREAPLLIRDIETALADRGVVVAKIVSATRLETTTATEIEKFIASQFEDISKIFASYTQDESLLGGIRITTPHFQYDDTLSARLQQLTTRNS